MVFVKVIDCDQLSRRIRLIFYLSCSGSIPLPVALFSQCKFISCSTMMSSGIINSRSIFLAHCMEYLILIVCGKCFHFTNA